MLALLLVALATAPTTAAAPPRPVGWWTFSDEAPLQDRSGYWPPLTLQGGAEVLGGVLRLGAVADDWFNSRALGWASATGYRGPGLSDKTIVVWVKLWEPDIRGGGVMSVDSVDDTDVFDGISWAELKPRRWTASSNYWVRSQQAVRRDEEGTGVLQLARIDDVEGDEVRVTLCRDGEVIARYADGPAASWTPQNAEVTFGKRHTSKAHPETGGLAGELHEARLYATALDCETVGAMRAIP